MWKLLCAVGLWVLFAYMLVLSVLVTAYAVRRLLDWRSKYK